MPDNFLSLFESVSLLLDELVLAHRWARPSILMAVYRSEFVRRDAGRMLEDSLQASGQVLHPVDVGRANFDVPLALVNAPDKGKTVFSVSGLHRGGGPGGLNAYRALNMRRELLVDDSLRVVFWLTEAESRRLARRAPDFWAFRHRVVSLVDVPVVPDMVVVARLGGPDDWQAFGEGGQVCLSLFVRGDVDAGIAVCRESLKIYRQNAGLWALLGTGLLALGQREESERAFNKARRCGFSNRVLQRLVDSSG